MIVFLEGSGPPGIFHDNHQPFFPSHIATYGINYHNVQAKKQSEHCVNIAKARTQDIAENADNPVCLPELWPYIVARQERVIARMSKPIFRPWSLKSQNGGHIRFQLLRIYLLLANQIKLLGRSGSGAQPQAQEQLT